MLCAGFLRDLELQNIKEIFNVCLILLRLKFAHKNIIAIHQIWSKNIKNLKKFKKALKETNRNKKI